ncbi:MAG: LysR substrate-binding domain-containing protein [Pseudomonas sp.]|uniref:LysR family transcriptional regulator n=1 Tax=Pseudomonas abieticivorans TaxID=2931382 RepID=UPI0020BF919E|nr:LysR family transcriptional regulator [Pseudomonas sp. PIA16]MDE1167849.1 LysR substrate-binding domain-containing protein [Pseudomonas sp.]
MDYFAALTAFVEAANGNNFSRAAERLGIKASTVSRYVKELEQDLGIALFNRSTRTLRLTEGGATFLHHAQRVLSELDQAKAATSALNQHPRGLLKLNLPPAFARHHVLPLLRGFTERYPEIRLELVLEEAKVDLIHSGVDLAIRIGVLTDSSLKARRIGDERSVLCVSAGFIERHGLPDTVEAVGQVPAILGHSAGDELLLMRTGEAHSVMLKGVISLADLDARLLAAQQGLGVAVLPDWLAAQSLRDGRLQVCLPEWTLHVSQPLWFIYPPKRIVSSKVRCFIDFVVQALGQGLKPGPSASD